MTKGRFVINIRSWKELEQIIKESGVSHIAESVPDGSTIAINPEQYENTGAKYMGRKMYWNPNYSQQEEE